VAALKRYHTALEERQAHVQRRWDEQTPVPSYVEAMFDYSLTMIEAERGWLEALIQRMEKEGA
jgi:hypothetical protein